jgi:hypothetical protein
MVMWTISGMHGGKVLGLAALVAAATLSCTGKSGRPAGGPPTSSETSTETPTSSATSTASEEGTQAGADTTTLVTTAVQTERETQTETGGEPGTATSTTAQASTATTTATTTATGAVLRCGDTAITGVAPGEALVCDGDRILCGAAIVEARLALTAGHCLAEVEPARLRVVTPEATFTVTTLCRQVPALRNNVISDGQLDLAQLVLAEAAARTVTLAAIPDKASFLAESKQNRLTFLSGEEPRGIVLRAVEGGAWVERPLPLRGAFGAGDEEWHAGFDGRQGRAVTPLGGFLYAPGGLIGIYSRPYTADAGDESDGGIFTDLTRNVARRPCDS